MDAHDVKPFVGLGVSHTCGAGDCDQSQELTLSRVASLLRTPRRTTL